jgi:hypothetical protein
MICHPQLTKHVPLVKYLGMQAVNSDESEDEKRRTINYPRVYPHWRSAQLAALMWTADAAGEADASTPLGHRKKPGTQLHICPHSSKFNDTAPAPVSLPRNCYDSEWLSKLTERARKELGAQDQDYDFLVMEGVGSGG